VDTQPAKPFYLYASFRRSRQFPSPAFENKPPADGIPVGAVGSEVSISHGTKLTEMSNERLNGNGTNKCWRGIDNYKQAHFVPARGSSQEMARG